ncbi:MAG: hypothetical protein O7C74_00590 [Acidobacteria bacterium]|nr:hypothetical protein [Acidobacteriota bacterium]
MTRTAFPRFLLAAAGAVLVLGTGTSVVTATEPCEDFGECKVLIEINSTDGDIGFHFLMDGDDLNMARIDDPNGLKVFEDQAKGRLKKQKMTETFVESAEPLCWFDPEADADEEIVTLEEFLERWTPGTYVFTGMGDGGEKSVGETELTYELPAAPSGLGFDGSVITWAAGADLGNCASTADLDDLVADGLLPVHPENVAVAAWEIVLEPDVDDGDPLGQLKFTIRVAGSIATKAVTVPADYLASLPNDTPAKCEVGAIGMDDNATFTEIFDLCLNEDEGCE